LINTGSFVKLVGRFVVGPETNWLHIPVDYEILLV